MITFPRQTRIFRGQFPAGAFAAVFVLFLIFFTFHTSLVYIPGLPVNLAAPGLMLKPHQTNTVTIDERLTYRFGGEVCRDFQALEARLREAARTNAGLRLLSIQAHPAVTNTVVRQVVELAQALGLVVDLPGGRLDLPVAGSLVVVTNPMVVVAVNLGGQIYFRNQVVPPDRLQDRLAEAVREAGRPVTLLVLADKAVDYQVIIGVGAAARSAGVQQVLLSTRPPLFQTQAGP